MATITILTLDNFGKIALVDDATVVVDFWAEWCHPCKMIAPVIEEISDEMPNITFGKIDVDSQETLARAYDIRAIPTLVLIKNAREVARTSGAHSKAQIKEWIEQHASAS